MMRASSIRSLFIALCASAGIMAYPAMAAPVLGAGAHEDGGDHAGQAHAAPLGVVEFTSGTSVLRAQMPCEEPAPTPPGLNQEQSSVCILGDRMFVFSVSSGVAPGDNGPMQSDFDAAFEEVRSSADTEVIEETEENGLRVMRASRDPASGFGVMQAVQFAPDAMVYVIAMARPGGDEALSETDKQEMRDFAASLEIEQ